MAMNVEEVYRWLGTLPAASSVAIDEDGMRLVEINPAGRETGAFCEIGGAPEGDDEETDEDPDDAETVAEALRCGFKQDAWAKARGDWFWYMPTPPVEGQHDTRAVCRDGEWRVYFETAREALNTEGSAPNT